MPVHNCSFLISLANPLTLNVPKLNFISLVFNAENNPRGNTQRSSKLITSSSASRGDSHLVQYFDGILEKVFNLQHCIKITNRTCFVVTVPKACMVSKS